MLKKIILGIALQGSAMLFAQEGILKINISDKVTGEALELASVGLESAGVLARSGVTDKEGNLVFKNLAPGEYNVKTVYTGYPTHLMKGVVIRQNETTYLDLKLSSENVMEGFTVVGKWEKPLIEPVPVTRTIFLRSEIENSPLTKPEDFAALVSGAVQLREGETPFFRGQRNNGVVYIIDGQKVIGSHAIPKGAIEQMKITIGGIPAQYGDATGAFIEIETRSGLVNPR